MPFTPSQASSSSSASQLRWSPPQPPQIPDSGKKPQIDISLHICTFLSHNDLAALGQSDRNTKTIFALLEQEFWEYETQAQIFNLALLRGQEVADFNGPSPRLSQVLNPATKPWKLNPSPYITEMKPNIPLSHRGYEYCRRKEILVCYQDSTSNTPTHYEYKSLHDFLIFSIARSGAATFATGTGMPPPVTELFRRGGLPPSLSNVSIKIGTLSRGLQAKFIEIYGPNRQSLMAGPSLDCALSLDQHSLNFIISCTIKKNFKVFDQSLHWLSNLFVRRELRHPDNARQICQTQEPAIRAMFKEIIERHLKPELRNPTVLRIIKDFENGVRRAAGTK